MPLNRRRFFATEVIQTSAIDCGPASLKSLLDGFRIRTSYGRLREACQTDVDGTSIDTIEGLYRPAWSAAILSELEFHKEAKLTRRGETGRDGS